MNNRLIIIVAFVLAFNAYALDPMYDYRYTFGPEVLVPDAFSAGVGFSTRLNEDGMGTANFQVGLSDFVEIGAKLLVGSNYDWAIGRTYHHGDTLETTLDAGIKFAIAQHWAVQLDVPIAINRAMDWGGVLSVAKWNECTKNISLVYEGRLAFGGAAGDSDYLKLAGALLPYAQFGEAFRLSIGLIASSSVLNIKDMDVKFSQAKKDIMVDFMPRMEAGFKWFRVMGEVTIGMYTWDSKIYNRFGGYVIKDI